MKAIERWALGGCVVLLVSALATVRSHEPESSKSDPRLEARNVKVTLTVGKQEGDSSSPTKSYELLTVSGGAPASLLVGRRIPVPKTTCESDSASGPVTSFSYQNVGFSASVETRVHEDGRIEVRGSAEASSVEPSLPGEKKELPGILTRHQSFRVFVRDGVPQVVTRAGDGYVEIRADLVY